MRYKRNINHEHNTRSDDSWYRDVALSDSCAWILCDKCGIWTVYNLYDFSNVYWNNTHSRISFHSADIEVHLKRLDAALGCVERSLLRIWTLYHKWNKFWENRGFWLLCNGVPLTVDRQRTCHSVDIAYCWPTIVPLCHLKHKRNIYVIGGYVCYPILNQVNKISNIST